MADEDSPNKDSSKPESGFKKIIKEPEQKEPVLSPLPPKSPSTPPRPSDDFVNGYKAGYKDKEKKKKSRF
jgi:hypothetical protein